MELLTERRALADVVNIGPKAKRAYRVELWLLALALIGIVQLVGVPNMDDYFLTIAIFAGINITMAVSLNLVNGFTGQFSMGHAGFMAVGAYAASAFSIFLRAQMPDIFVVEITRHISFAAALMVGGCAAALSGYIVGLPSLRLKGDYLAIVTLGFGEIIRVLILNTDAIGGARGLPDIPKITNFAWVYSVALICTFVVWRLVKSPYGRELLAVREDEIAAVSVGVNTTQAKVRAFVVGAFFAGTGGALFGHYLMFLTPSSFDFNRSFEFIIMVVLGGMGSISGSIIAALFLTGIREALRDLQEWRMIIYSLTLIAMMLIRPKGLLGTREIFQYLPTRWRMFFGSEDLPEHRKPGS